MTFLKKSVCLSIDFAGFGLKKSAVGCVLCSALPFELQGKV
jgi:hypothetical protein